MVFDFSVILSQWQSYGVFDYVLPFLLIFAIVYGILAKTNVLGNNKSVLIIISLVLGLLALQTPYVKDFFAEGSARLAVGLLVLLSLIILITVMGVDPETAWGSTAIWVIFGVGLIIWFVATLGSFDRFSFGIFEDYASLILAVLLLIGVIVAVTVSSSSGAPKAPKTHG